eukprot:8790924-Alexandrium_andersonii.AAC.1
MANLRRTELRLHYRGLAPQPPLLLPAGSPVNQMLQAPRPFCCRRLPAIDEPEEAVARAVPCPRRAESTQARAAPPPHAPVAMLRGVLAATLAAALAGTSDAARNGEAPLRGPSPPRLAPPPPGA